MNRLYPLKFKPIIKEKIWGGTRLKSILNKNLKTDKAGESWEISGFPGQISKVSNGFLSGNSLEELIEVYMGDLVGDGVFEKFGTLFPLLIKFIDANDTLSVQVHPDDKLARKHFGSYGKTEMWYILEAEKNAEIFVGFNKAVDKDTWQKHVEQNTLLSVLNKEIVSAGDVFYIPSGRIHTIGPGILLAEIQQTSDATLRVYDYNRLDEKGKPRELHTELAIEAIDFNVYPEYKVTYNNKPGNTKKLVTCEYFTVNLIDLHVKSERNYHELDSFVIYICLDGRLSIQYYGNETELLRKGETILIPAEIKEIKLIPETKTRILEVYIEGLNLKDRTSDLLEKLF